MATDRSPPRLAIVGPDPDQQGQIARRCADLAVDLRFPRRSALGGRLPDVDVIILSKHVKHAWVEKAKRAMGDAGRNRVRWLTGGGVTAVAREVRRLVGLPGAP